MEKKDLVKFIDHTLLKPTAGTEEIERLAQEGLKYGFASVCVNLVHIPRIAQILEGSEVKATAVIGFPLGATLPEVKAFETAQAVKWGAGEIDMMLNIGALKDRNLDLVRRDIAVVCEAAEGRIVKVIIETCCLTEEEKVLACQAAKEVGAQFVKTSTGFGTGGATVEDVALMRKVVGDRMGVKASGGIKTFADAVRMIEAGASRIGTSSGVAIIEGFSADNKY
jgi:deoxyribose-phosphate aldolase